MTISGNLRGGISVRINSNVNFSGSPDDINASASPYKLGAEGMWTRADGPDDIRLLLTPGEGGISINIDSNTSVIASTDTFGGKNINLPTLIGYDGAGVLMLRISVFSHEIGHSLGLKDRQRNATIERGYRGNIMAQGYMFGSVNSQVMREVASSCQSPQSD
jgi:hypothetical protein